jgi:hypothetical protein
VSATHGSAHLALYDQETWDKYQLAQIVGADVTRNTFALALFGCRRHRPLLHHGSAGLLWAINGGRLAQLHLDRVLWSHNYFRSSQLQGR